MPNLFMHPAFDDHERAVFVNDPAKTDHAKDRFDAEAMAVEALLSQPMEVFAPCALGGILSHDVAGQLHAKVVAGAANNQLFSEDVGNTLTDRNILYAPDYVINAGGIINIASEIAAHYDRDVVTAAVLQIPTTLSKIFAEAENRDLPKNVVADTIARRRLLRLGEDKRAA